MPPVLITGAAGFVGFHLARRYLDEGRPVVGLDNLNDYYEVELKEARLAELEGRAGFTFARADLADAGAVNAVFATHGFETVVHLAAQAGVRYSLENPGAYAQSNLVGFVNMLEACRHGGVKHLLYASSSSVYGQQEKTPFSVHDNVDHPISLYAATKKSNELMAHVYSHLFRLPTTGLRFFTVYGPYGRPDMAPYLFTRAILKGEPIKVFNEGRMMRDFTYIDDIVEGVRRLADVIPEPNPDFDPMHPDPGSGTAPYRVYNIGNNTPEPLMRFIAILEQALGKEAVKQYLPMQPGDVPATYADISDLERVIGFRPSTSLEEGVGKFVGWFRGFYKV